MCGQKYPPAARAVLSRTGAMRARGGLLGNACPLCLFLCNFLRSHRFGRRKGASREYGRVAMRIHMTPIPVHTKTGSNEYRHPRPPIFILCNTGLLEANSTLSLCRKVCGRVCKWIVLGQPPTSPSSKKRKTRNKENPETKKEKEKHKQRVAH